MSTKITITGQGVVIPAISTLPRGDEGAKYAPDQPRDDHGRFGSTFNPHDFTAAQALARDEERHRHDDPLDQARLDLDQTLVDQVRATGGFTYDPRTEAEPVHGYSVAAYPERSEVHEAADFDVAKLETFETRNADVLKDPSMHIGAWANEGKIYLDITQVEPDQATAERLGRERNQIAIWSLHDKVEISTGGTGQIAAAAPIGAYKATIPDHGQEKEAQAPDPGRLRPSQGDGGGPAEHRRAAQEGRQQEGLKYSPDQPRIPAGQSGGGEFGTTDATPTKLSLAEYYDKATDFNQRVVQEAADPQAVTHALYKYAMTSNINARIRLVKPDLSLERGLTPELMAQVATIDKAIAASSPLERPVEVYRAMPTQMLASLKEGRVFSDRAFCSTTAWLPFAWEWANQLDKSGALLQDMKVVRIQLPVGARVAPLDAATGMDMKEMLLPRDTRFRVTQVGDDDSPWVFKVVS